MGPLRDAQWPTTIVSSASRQMTLHDLPIPIVPNTAEGYEHNEKKPKLQAHPPAGFLHLLDLLGHALDLLLLLVQRFKRLFRRLRILLHLLIRFQRACNANRVTTVHIHAHYKTLAFRRVQYRLHHRGKQQQAPPNTRKKGASLHTNRQMTVTD